MYTANFVFALVEEGGCGGRGKSECVCDMSLHMRNAHLNFYLLHMCLLQIV